MTGTYLNTFFLKKCSVLNFYITFLKMGYSICKDMYVQERSYLYDEILF